MNPLTILTTFVAIFPAELPDKTMVASMVLAIGGKACQRLAFPANGIALHIGKARR